MKRSARKDSHSAAPGGSGAAVAAATKKESTPIAGLKKGKAKDGRAEKRNGASLIGLPQALGLGLRFTCLAIVYSFGYLAAGSGVLFSEVENKMNILGRCMFFYVAQSSSADFLAVIFLQIGRHLCKDRGCTTFEPTDREMRIHDSTIAWPPLELLNEDLRPFVSKHGQPFFLNRVPGRQRCKDACVRVGKNIGSLVAVLFMCTVLDGRSLASLGLTFDGQLVADSLAGVCTGASIVAAIFFFELSAGWISFLRSFEVFDSSERFATCFFWDVVFHLNVAMHQELAFRGWLLHGFADAFMARMNVSPTKAFFLAGLVEATLFSVNRLRSPAPRRLRSAAMIFVGAFAASMNVVFTGGRLGFTLGWHFGWNIFMGNVFGLSANGIPISCSVLSVVPHPDKKRLHGGTSGPEGGVLGPFAYLFGVMMLALLYGLPGGAVGR